MCKISVITINYNEKEGLKKTIQSVVGQTYGDIEYIVIDGGSTDGSKEIIEEYKDKIDYWVSEPDSGIYNAMNKGIRAAKGEYVLFMNSGDCFYENDTVAKAETLMSGDYGIYYGDLIYYNKRKKKYENWIFPNKLSLGFFIENSLPHQGSFIKRSLFDSISMYNENLKIASDWEFFIIAICVEKVSYKHIGIVISEYDFTGISSDPKNYQLVASEKKLTFDKYFSMMIDDYKIIKLLDSKRFRNVIYIKEYRIAWKLLKGFSNFLLVFLPKQDNSYRGYRY
jgi:glycosyltransferase involved in cell wall biosynthesis